MCSTNKSGDIKAGKFAPLVTAVTSWLQSFIAMVLLQVQAQCYCVLCFVAGGI